MATQPRPLGYKAKRQVEFAVSHLRRGQQLVERGLHLMDRDPDTAAEHFSDAHKSMVVAENILLRLQLGDFED